MALTPLTVRSTSPTFPSTAIENRLRIALTQLEKDVAAIRDEWDPAFDSLAVVKILCCIDEVAPGLDIAPEKVVRKGGYSSLDDALQHILGGIERAWQKKHS